MKHFRLVLGALMSVTAISIACSTITNSPASTPNPGQIVAPGDAAVSRQQQTSLEITYVANEGVLISSGGKRVLIDGLHREYETYASLPAAQRELIETAKAPFDNIDLLLVSHMHLDHFHPESVGLHLRHNPKTMLVSSQQVIGEVEKHFKDYEAIKARVTGATPPLKEKVFMKVAGVDFEILGLGHGSERHGSIQNLGHLIKLGGRKLLHVGDADTSAEIFEKFNLDEEGIDIAFLPYWFLLGDAGQTVVREHIKPKHIVAVHLPTDAEKVAGQIRKIFPDAAVFTTMLEKRHYYTK
ncbi:MAG TPA: MBL fold metallo-hydrolase [Pyrinomonadaceae bacterium]